MQLNAVELHYNVHIYCIDTSIERNPALQFQTFAKLRRSTKQVESAKIHQHASQSTVENLGLASTCRSFCFRNWGKRRAKSSKRRLALENVTRPYSHATCSKHVQPICPTAWLRPGILQRRSARKSDQFKDDTICIICSSYESYSHERETNKAFGLEGNLKRKWRARSKGILKLTPWTLFKLLAPEEKQKILSSSVLDRCSSMGWSVPSDTSVKILENLSCLQVCLRIYCKRCQEVLEIEASENPKECNALNQVTPKQKLGLEGIWTSACCHGCRAKDSSVW